MHCQTLQMPFRLNRRPSNLFAVFMGAINIYSPKAGSKIQVLFFLVKLAATFVIIGGGFYSMAIGKRGKTPQKDPILLLRWVAYCGKCSKL